MQANPSHYKPSPVFTPPRLFVVAAFVVAATAAPLSAQEQETLQAWSQYVQLTERRIDREMHSSDGFLAQDFQAPAQARADRQAMLSGKLVVAKMQTANLDDSAIEVPGGMIHHWRGSVFIPGASLEQVLEAVRYSNANEHRQQDVLESRVLERTADTARVYLKLVRSKIVTVTYNTEHLVRYHRHGPRRASSRTTATKVAELANAGTPSEREKPPGEDRGFLWRLNSYWRYEQVKGGVLVECESLTLSRPVPAIVAPLVRPIIQRVARESMGRTLSSMRERFADLG